MKNKNRWIDFSILALCMVGLLGLLLRSKIVFELPLINYNHLLEGHSHFTFGGWVSLALMTSLVLELLPPSVNQKYYYQWLLGGIAISSWGMLLAYLLEGYGYFSIICSFIFILITYVFGYVFTRDVVKTDLPKPIVLLAVSSIICLVLSSFGIFIIAYIYFTKSFEAILYRDALFTYLHFQYNGFFSLSIFALLFKLMDNNILQTARKNAGRFAVLLCISIIPSLFLSYLWQDPNKWFWVIAITGSLLLLLCCILLILTLRQLHKAYLQEIPVIRFLIFISMSSFLLKIFLQCFTIFPVIGNAIFGNRPIIMGFLHLVFLAFTTLFILAFFTRKGWLDGTKKFTIIALIVFTIAITCNEIVLLIQGLANILLAGSNLFAWLLWIIGICLFIGTMLIGIARIKTSKI